MSPAVRNWSDPIYLDTKLSMIRRYLKSWTTFTLLVLRFSFKMKYPTSDSCADARYTLPQTQQVSYVFPHCKEHNLC